MPSASRAKGAAHSRSAVSSRSKKLDIVVSLPLLRSALAIAAISASGLAYESLLTRLFSLVFQYHFAFVAVSLAVFGLGTGALLAYISGWTSDRQRTQTRLIRLGLAMAIVLPLSVVLFSRLVASDLSVVTILVSLAPFLIAGMFSAVLYAHQSGQGAVIYSADLGGAALGLALSLSLIGLVGAFNAVFLAGCLSAMAALALSRKIPDVYLPASVIVVLLALVGLNLKTGWIDLPPMLGSVPPDKVMYSVLADPSQAARPVDSLWSAFARVDLVETSDPGQMDVFTDAGAGSFMLRFDGDLSKVSWLAQQPGYLPFMSGPVDKVLVLGAGAGKDIVQALLAGSKDITAVEINPAMVAITRKYADYNGGILDYPGVKTVVADGRNFIEHSQDRYDLLYMNLVYAQAAQPGSAALTESYVFTVDAFQAYWQRLAEDGRIAIVSHQALEGSRALLTSLEALQREGMPTSQGLKHTVLLMQPSDDPNQRLTVLILSRNEWTSDQTANLLNYANALGLQPLFVPGHYEDTMNGLTNDKITIREFLTDPQWDLSPTTDNRPFFFNLTHGLPSPVITMLWVSAAGLLVFLLLIFLSRSKPQASQLEYFMLSGLGFMLLEMPLLQRMILLLGSPTLAAVAVLGALLIGAGAGSLISRKWKTEDLLDRVLAAALTAGGLTVVMVFVQPVFVNFLLPTSEWIRFTGAILMVLLLAVPLGIPFSSGLRLLDKATPGKTALLWGWNAAAAVLGSAVSVSLAILAGFSWALLSGALCYLALALLVFFLRRRGTAW